MSNDQCDDHEDQCMARHPGFACTCEQLAFEAAAESNPEQLCFAVATKTGTLVTRDGRPLWASRRMWDSLPALVTQTIPIDGAPPVGSLPLEADSTPDIVGRVFEVMGFLERGAAALGQRAEHLETAAQDMAASLSARVHERELLARAAELIDPDSDTPVELRSYEQRLDWLAKWREVTGRG